MPRNSSTSVASARPRKHGVADTRLWRTWKAMKDRCLNPRAQAAKNYHNRGISVCREWLSFAGFRSWAMANGYADDLTIERTDNDGHYEPSNCMWASKPEQNRNKRTGVFLFAFGEKKKLWAWAEDSRCAVSYGTLQQRILKGWDHESAIVRPSRKHRRADG